MDIDAPIPAAPPPAPAAAPEATSGPALGALVVAGLASLGAGAIHAAAIGVHSEHQQAVIAFTAVAAFQLAWGVGALGLRVGSRLFAAVGALGHGAAAVGWLLAKTTGISVIAGLEEAESVQLADGVAAGLALVAGALAARELLIPAGLVRRSRHLVLPATAFPVVVLTLAAMVSAGSHSHAGGHGAAGHADGEHADGGHADEHDPGEGEGAGAHEPAVVPPVRYDPNLPINLSGVPGVTLEQQARAENLIALTLARLPQYADPATAEAAGFRSIGDGFTGHEHYVNWDYLSDGRILDPDYPESLVYDTRGPTKRLVSAMFMAEPGTTLDSVPDIGGRLTQWHVHEDLCFTTGENPRVVGLTSTQSECPPPTEKLGAVPMIHVWIEPHPCGPFAALEGVAAGQIREGEEQLCDHVHGGAN